MARTKTDTFNDNPLNPPDIQEVTQGILWDIAFVWERKLANLRTDIEKWQLKKELEAAKERERFILEYLGIDTYLWVEIPKKKRADFKVAFSLNIEEVRVQRELYENLLSLYALKHIEVTAEMIQSWIREKKTIIIEFGVTGDKSAYFIRNLRIEDPKK